MKAGLVSAVIPAYNYGRYVCEAVESALGQTYHDIEVIVVDDGSIDDTRTRLERFGRKIRYIYQENKGLSAARNAGIRAAEGEWIALLDADDVWHQQKTEIQLAAIGPFNGVGLVGSPPVPALGNGPLSPPAVRELSVRDFLLSSRTGPSGTLIRRECFDVVGFFDEGLTSIEDRDMWLRIAARFPCVQVLSPCWWYRPHAGQMSRRAKRMLMNYQKVLTKFFDEHPEHKGLQRLAWSYLYMDGTWCALDEGDVKTARELMILSIYMWPWLYRDSKLRPFVRSRIMARLLLGEALFRKVSSPARESQF
jgi:glycosyltransferase involved in cell wall biosynthesis